MVRFVLVGQVQFGRSGWVWQIRFGLVGRVRFGRSDLVWQVVDSCLDNPGQLSYMALVNIALYSSKVGFGKLGWVLQVALIYPKLPYFPQSCPTLPYVALSYPKVGLYSSKTETRVPGGGGVVVVVGWWCKPIIVSNPTFVELCQVVLGLSWGCVVGFEKT